MHLQKIELNGFKSFRDKTVVKFDKGITALLGRNGHGKSNLVDAIRWALAAGSRATKDLRVKKNQDVIFAGTYDDKHNMLSPPKDYAEVAVTFSNEDGAIKIEAPTVEIRRVMDRSGQSDYFINRQKVKAEDIKFLLYDTGIGKTGYSILEQGKIAKLLSDKPEERRTVFEEAAGISGYKNEMDEANRRVSDTNENIKLVEIDFNRLKSRNEKLRIQKDNLIRYKSLKDKSFEIAVKARLIDLRDAEDEKTKNENRLKKNEEELRKLKEKTEKQQKETEERSSLVESLYKEKNEITTAKGTISTDVALLKQSLEMEESRLREEQRRFDESKAALDDMKERSKAKDTELKEELKKRDEALKKNDALNKELNTLKLKAEALQKDAEKLEKNAAEKDVYLKNLREKLEKEIDVLIKALYSALDDLKSGKEKSFDTSKNILSQIEAKFEEYKKAQPVFVDELLKKQQDELDKKRSEITEKTQEKTKEISEHQLQIERVRTSVSSLEESVSIIKDEIKKLEEGFATFKENLQKINANIKQFKETISEKEKEFAVKLKLEKGIDEKLNKLTSIDTTKINEANQKINELIGTNGVIKGKLEAAIETIEKLKSDFFDEYGKSINEVRKEIDLKEGDNKDDIRRSLSKITQDIKECGIINEYAEVEWQENNEQYLLVKAQLDDLNKAKADSKLVYDELKTRSAEQFLETFEKIKVSFDQTFKVMFGGGNGNLELHHNEDEEIDPLTCGIDIMVQPPGKTMRLMGLSGGEADKVAAVLLFSIYRIKSTPFCILDEIDHAWDSHNISAFLEMLRHFTDNTQFLIVTHQLQTAKGVDRLLGVTQEEEGVSKVFDYAVDKNATTKQVTLKGKGINLKS